jgi:hypothetical protein
MDKKLTQRLVFEIGQLQPDITETENWPVVTIELCVALDGERLKIQSAPGWVRRTLSWPTWRLLRAQVRSSPVR